MRPRCDQKHAIDAVENRIAKRGTRYHHTITQVVQRVRNTGSPTCQGDKACLKGSRRCERLIDTTSCHVRGKTAAITCAFLALSGPRRGRQRLGGLARCHDTDDTNRGYGDTQTIRCMVKMARSDAFQTRIMSSTISLGRPTTRRRLWDCLIVLYPAKPGRNPSM